MAFAQSSGEPRVCPKLKGAQIGVTVDGISGLADNIRLAFASDQPQLECPGDGHGDLVLQGEHLRPFTVEALGPQVATGLGVDQLGVDASCHPPPGACCPREGSAHLAPWRSGRVQHFFPL